MEVIVKELSSSMDIIISGNIKSISDTDVIKSAIIRAWNKDESKSLNIFIDDSFIITSSVIGFLIKFIKKDRMPITLYVKNDELYEMLDDMNLVEALNIRR
jgi:hypothetical protein